MSVFARCVVQVLRLDPSHALAMADTTGSDARVAALSAAYLRDRAYHNPTIPWARNWMVCRSAVETNQVC